MHQPDTTRKRAAALTAMVIWAALVLGLYYWVHKPLTPPLMRALGGALLDVVTAAVCVALAGGLGRRLLRPLDLSDWSIPERAAGAALVGLGALSLLIFAVGVVVLHALSMIALAVLVAVLTRADLAAWLRDLGAWAQNGLPRDGWTRFLAISVLVLLVAALILSTLPPSKWDVLTYHLAGPEGYADHGRFYAMPHNHFLGFPQLVDTLYAAEIAVTGRLTSGGPLHCLIGALALLLTGGYAARHAGRTAGWLAAALIITPVTIWLEMTFAYVDLMPMGLAMVGLAVAGSWNDTRSRNRYLVLLGAVAGFAMGTKYTALWLGAGLGLLVLWLGRTDGWRALVRYGLIYGITAALVTLPWLVRNAAWYDNPVYPFVFDAGEMDALRRDWYSQPESGLIYRPAEAWQIPIMPLAATVFGVEGSGTYSTDIGPLFVILLPLLALTWAQLAAAERAMIRQALVLAGVMTACWVASAAVGSYMNIQTRLVLYIFPPLAVVAALALESLRRLPDKPLNLGFVLRAMVGLVIVFALIDGARIVVTSGIHAYYSAEDDYQDAFMAHKLGWHYEAIIRQVNTLPPGSCVRLLWEPRSLYCDETRVSCRPDSLMDAWYYARRTVGGGDPAAIAAAWQADGDPDYLLVYEFGRRYERDHSDQYDPADWAAWDVFVADHLDEVWRGGNADDDIQYILYTWRRSPENPIQ
ncbi:MAG: hypothetical protein JXJ20_01875 [Anaerolineae bacterium]|nr:hypothetical protein [Anaerolineae bacterium]